MDIYRLWRATPLYRARRLEKALDTPAHIYYKYEGTSPAGSHKPNTAVAQAYYNKRAGIRRLATETGAGQWGSALSLACQLFGLECTVYMVRVSYDQKPYRRMMMHAWGARGLRQPQRPDQLRPRRPGRNARFAGQPGHRHQRSRGRRRHPRRHQLRPGQRAQSRDAAPDRDRPGSQAADGAGRRRARSGHRLLRRRQQFRRAGAALRARPASRQGPAHCRRGTGRLPQPHQGHLRLRLTATPPSSPR